MFPLILIAHIRRHQILESNLLHTCQLLEANSAIVQRVSRDEVDVIYNYGVEISGGADPLNGNAGTCNIAVLCLSFHYVDGFLVCDQADNPPTDVPCWTTQSGIVPQCAEPGSAWIGALVGCVITAFFALAFLATALVVSRSIRNNPSIMPQYYATGVVVGQPVAVQVVVADPATTVQLR